MTSESFEKSLTKQCVASCEPKQEAAPKTFSISAGLFTGSLSGSNTISHDKQYLWCTSTWTSAASTTPTTNHATRTGSRTSVLTPTSSISGWDVALEVTDSGVTMTYDGTTYIKGYPLTIDQLGLTQTAYIDLRVQATAAHVSNQL